jgi:hypothetical protein
MGITAQSNKPAKLWNQWTVKGRNGLSQFAANKAVAGTGKQMMPITS